MSNENPPYLNTSQAARLMRVSASTVRKYCENGSIPGAIQIRNNGPWQIPYGSVAAWIKDHSSPGDRPTNEPGPPTAWKRFRYNPYIFYPTMVFIVISAILGLIATLIAITGNWDDTIRLAKERGLILAFPEASEDEILIVIFEFQYSENLVNTEAHNEIRWAIEEAVHNLGIPPIRVQVHPAKLDADDLQMAQRLGERYRANLFIWGEDTGAHVIVNFLNIKNPDYFISEVRISEKQKTQLSDPEAYAQYVTDDLPSQLTFLSLLAIGQTLYWAGETSSAITIFEETLSSIEKEQSPVDWLSIAYYFLGDTYQFPGFDLDRSIEFYDKALQLAPDFSDAYNNRGNAWSDKGDFEKALSDYNKAIQLDSNFTEAYNNRGIAWKLKGDMEKAIADFEKAIQINSNYALAYYNRGGVWKELGDLDKSIIDYDKAIQLDPTFADAYNFRGIAWGDKGDIKKALNDFDKAIQIDPGFASAYYNRGIVLSYSGALEKALDDYSKAIELDPKFVDAYINRANALFGKGDFDRAIFDYDKVILLDPNSATAYYLRGNAWVLKEESDKAIVDFDKAIQLDPDFTDAYEIRGIAWAFSGDWDKAIADYTKAIQIDPNLVSAYYNRGNAWKEKGELENAVADFRHYLELSPDADERESVEQWISEFEEQIANP